MIKFILGFILGLIVATVGVQGVINIGANSIVKTQEVAKDLAK